LVQHRTSMHSPHMKDYPSRCRINVITTHVQNPALARPARPYAKSRFDCLRSFFLIFLIAPITPLQSGGATTTTDMAINSESLPARKAVASANNMTYRSSSPSTSQFTLDEPSRGRKPFSAASTSAPNAAYAVSSDVMASMNGPARGAVQSGSDAGDYAYSTTLRRQPSYTFDGPAFSLPSHHRNRSASLPPYRRGQDVAQTNGVWDKVVGLSRKVLGREGYEAVDAEEEQEARRKSIERRQRETPSAIYAHRSVDVSCVEATHSGRCPHVFAARAHGRIQSETFQQIQRLDSPLPLWLPCWRGMAQTNSSYPLRNRYGSNSPKECTKIRSIYFFSGQARSAH
jgi:hypothetical protein